ncbi:hypothetical protein F503_07321 [Ophiostoma piceae UAMH 11346]|uniref:Nineteen complex-related protein 2-domain-containing protein n=1 Tax=Ophiostoma piceae (strain UAMH 11346) TaxID=1262450 RepID=S3D7Y5_OPHP1|nr:hypothetical protein F503_07321 [Ophiostoma piceae UAMH 11346]
MSLFTKRKGRRISSFEDDEEPATPSGSAPTGDKEPVVKPIRFGKRPIKQSALRRSININEPDSLGTDPSDFKSDAAEDAPKPETKADDVNDDDEPALVRPSLLARSNSRRKKNRLSTASTTSRLSFGGGGRADDDNDDGNDDTPAVVTPKRDKAAGGPSLTQRVLETNAFRKSLSSRLPTRQRPDYDDDEDTDRNRQKHKSDYDDDDDDDGRPRYSQAYLDELQNSTPNTPVNLSAMQKQEQRQNGGRGGIVDDADLMDLDPSELDGAMLVDSAELNTMSSDVSLRDRLGLGAVLPPPPAANVLTETEIQERKDRRARRALEEESISLGASDDEESGYISLLTDDQKRKRKEKESTRLVREDDDLGEGFDEFVEDKHAPLALGKKAEREARRRRKQEMADLISAAGQSQSSVLDNDDSDDSEAERRAAYDAAQTRAGMDGLHRVDNDDDEDGAVVHGGIQIPKMMSALPDLSDCLQQMQSALRELEVGVAQHRHKLAEVAQEKAEITARETEVQSILDAAAAKYQAILGGKNAKDANDANDGEAQDTKQDGPPVSAPAFSTFSPMRPLAPGQSPLRVLPPGLAGDIMPIERGLESLGTTPTRRPQADDYF